MGGNIVWKLLNLKMKNLVLNLMIIVGYIGVKGRKNKIVIIVVYFLVLELEDIILF